MLSQCLNCTAGYYCSSYGLTAVEGPCIGGYVCKGGAATSTWEVCPVGHFCPEATPHPQPCPIGTFSNITRLINQSQCKECLEGRYCAMAGASDVTGYCQDGYYCPQGSETASPSSFICPTGYHCPTGSSAPLPCPSGSYTNTTGLSDCIACPAGYYCLSVNKTEAAVTDSVSPGLLTVLQGIIVHQV